MKTEELYQIMPMSTVMDLHLFIQMISKLKHQLICAYFLKVKDILYNITSFLICSTFVSIFNTIHYNSLFFHWIHWLLHFIPPQWYYFIYFCQRKTERYQSNEKQFNNHNNTKQVSIVLRYPITDFDFHKKIVVLLHLHS